MYSNRALSIGIPPVSRIAGSEDVLELNLNWPAVAGAPLKVPGVSAKAEAANAIKSPNKTVNFDKRNTTTPRAAEVQG